MQEHPHMPRKTFGESGKEFTDRILRQLNWTLHEVDKKTSEMSLVVDIAKMKAEGKLAVSRSPGRPPTLYTCNRCQRILNARQVRSHKCAIIKPCDAVA